MGDVLGKAFHLSEKHVLRSFLPTTDLLPPLENPLLQYCSWAGQQLKMSSLVLRVSSGMGEVQAVITSCQLPPAPDEAYLLGPVPLPDLAL